MKEENGFIPRHRFLVCVDSDGCAFDTMGVKHRECFCPAFVEHFGLSPVAAYARDAWEFVNLLSRTRGIHRFPALERALSLLAARCEAAGRAFAPPKLEGLSRWLAEKPALTNDALRAAANSRGDADLGRVLAWSDDVNGRIARTVRGVPPFRHVRESLAEAGARADIVVVSATPTEALEREWAEHGLAGLVSVIYGQEVGGKKEIIASLAARYGDGAVLMVGDAPGDLSAARANGARFYPVRPDDEEASWRDFPAWFHRLVSGTYDEAPLIEAFDRILPESPPWGTA